MYSSEGQARRKQARKRSLRVVNEHSEPVFNAAWASWDAFRTEPNRDVQMLRYRADIDGLRALAVLGVVIFHLQIGVLHGGYSGVDIFFVISGYLISRTIYEEILESRFSIAEFYVRRARRILPGFFSVIILTSIIACLTLYPSELTAYAKSAIASALFSANIYFYSALNYFSPNATEIPLLHLWSLGVEEQFYIFFPLIAVASMRPGKIWLHIAIAGTLVSSLAASQAYLYIDPTNSFYLLHSRAFELLIGSIIALPTFPTIRNSLASAATAFAGLVAISMSFLLYDDTIRFPGMAALLPCIGAACIIIGCKQQNPISNLLSVKPLNIIGRISYSLYLVHWPLIVFANRFYPDADIYNRAIAIFIASLLLAWINYTIVEQPFRKVKPQWKSFKLLGISAASLGCVIAISGFVAVNDGFPRKASTRTANALAMLQYNPAHDYLSRTCFLDPDQPPLESDRAGCLPDPTKKTVMLWGDSHAIHLYGGLKPLLAERGYSLGALTASVCAPILDEDVIGRPFCSASNDQDFAIIKQLHPSILILSAGWNYTVPSVMESLKKTVTKLTDLGLKVVVLGEAPTYKQRVPLLVIKRIEAGTTEMSSGHDLDLQKIIGSEEAVSAALKGTSAKYISVYQAACPKGVCPMANAEEIPYHYDNVHLTPAGSRYYAKEILPQILR